MCWQAYKDEFLEAWKSKELDAVIGPVTLFPAVTCGKEEFFFGILFFFFLHALAF